MLSKEMREILVKAFNEIHDADKVAEIFNVSRRTVYTYVEKARAGESLEVRTSERGRKANLVPAIGRVFDFAHIRETVTAQDEGGVDGKIVVKI